MLVPGSAGCNSVLKLVTDQSITGLTAGFDTFVTAISIAYGLMLSTVVLPRRFTDGLSCGEGDQLAMTHAATPGATHRFRRVVQLTSRRSRPSRRGGGLLVGFGGVVVLSQRLCGCKRGIRAQFGLLRFRTGLFRLGAG